MYVSSIFTWNSSSVCWRNCWMLYMSNLTVQLYVIETTVFAQAHHTNMHWQMFLSNSSSDMKLFAQNHFLSMTDSHNTTPSTMNAALPRKWPPGLEKFHHVPVKQQSPKKIWGPYDVICKAIFISPRRRCCVQITDWWTRSGQQSTWDGEFIMKEHSAKTNEDKEDRHTWWFSSNLGYFNPCISLLTQVTVLC